MPPPDLRTALHARVLDPQAAALLWLLVDGGVPLVLTGPAPASSRSQLAATLLSIDPARRWLVVDADQEALTTERLAALLRGGTGLGVTIAAADLASVLERLQEAGLPEDGVRRLGAVVILDHPAVGLRCTTVHYLRPVERDAGGHLQRRPPALLSAWDSTLDAFEDYAWGITPELADRVGRSQADLEERRADRARLLATLAAGDGEDTDQRVATYLAAEPARQPAPDHDAAGPSPFRTGLLDPHDHRH